MSIAAEVFIRYVLNNPSPQLFELSIYCFVWVIYLGGALATRYNQHVRFDLIYRSLPEKARRVLEIVFDLLTNGVLLVLFYPGGALHDRDVQDQGLRPARALDLPADRVSRSFWPWCSSTTSRTS